MEINLGERALGTEYTKKAYDLRDRASDPERFYIDSHYYQNVLGDLDKTIQVYQLWAQTYPRDFIPPGNLSVNYTLLGQWEKALPEAIEGRKLADDALTAFQVASVYMGLGRLDEAKATVNQAIAKNLDVATFHALLYDIAFIQRDSTAMSHELSVLSNGGPLSVSTSYALGAGTEGYFGRFAKARELSQKAQASWESMGQKQQVATTIFNRASAEAELGDAPAAKREAAAGLAVSSSFSDRSYAAYIFARAGDSARAESLATELVRERPSATMLNRIDIPTTRAVIEMNRNNFAKAVELLEPVQPYDMANNRGLLSPYLRGQAYLGLHRGNEAAAEFQKLLDHPGIVRNSILGALAHLELGRAYVVAGDKTKARAAYQDFLALWKDADPDVPILKRAKAEYAKLQ